MFARIPVPGRPEIPALLAWAALMLAGSCPGATNNPIVFVDKLQSISDPRPSPVVIWSETRTTPRPIRMHFLRFDLESRDFEAFAIIGDDPDGDGPAEAKLEEPEELFVHHGAIAAVNANAFSGFPDKNGKIDESWSLNQPVDIVGLAASGGSVRSQPSPEHSSFWIATDGRARFGKPQDTSSIRDGISDWSGVLVHRGEEAPLRGGNLHPRTLLGMDKSGRWLLLVAIDGRRKGYSEGVTLAEAAAVMKEHGCLEAICLDGGGSSSMLAADAPGKKPRIVNQPSGDNPRPVPVMLGIRLKTKTPRADGAPAAPADTSQ